MYSFDPAINYGPNDAGASALSITLAVIAILVGSWLFGAAYGLIANYLKKDQRPGDFSEKKPRKRI